MTQGNTGWSMSGTPTRASMLTKRKASASTKPKTKRISIPQIPTGSAGPHAPKPPILRAARGELPIPVGRPPAPHPPARPRPGGGWHDPDSGGWGGDQSNPINIPSPVTPRRPGGPWVPGRGPMIPGDYGYVPTGGPWVDPAAPGRGPSAPGRGPATPGPGGPGAPPRSPIILGSELDGRGPAIPPELNRKNRPIW
jgi:hypothetical protein